MTRGKTVGKVGKVYHGAEEKLSFGGLHLNHFYDARNPNTLNPDLFRHWRKTRKTTNKKFIFSGKSA
jgi:hypothetical protein